MISANEAFNNMRESKEYEKVCNKYLSIIEKKIKKQINLGNEQVIIIAPFIGIKLKDRKRIYSIIFRELYILGYDINSKFLKFTISWKDCMGNEEQRTEINSIMDNRVKNKIRTIGFLSKF